MHIEWSAFLRKRKKGQVMVEALVSWVIFVLIFIVSMQVMWVMGVRSYMNQKLYESLFCLSKGFSKSDCKKEMIHKIEKVLVWGKIKNIKWDLKKINHQQVWKGSLLWEFQIWKVYLERSLNIPKDLLQ